MELEQARQLISNNYIQQPGVTTWADLGCGSGLFTRALAGLLAPGSIIYAADRNPSIPAAMLQENKAIIKPQQLDFITDKLRFGILDGILMANSLHFAADKPALLQKLEKSLAPKACFLIVEYDTDKANPWVPYPLSFHTLRSLFKNAGYTVIEKLNERPSVYGRANMYAVLIHK